ncbi:MAG: ubiquinol-cytochrome c reductase iron-sulfur subunit [Halodesulfurarchaeum sp.]
MTDESDTDGVRDVLPVKRRVLNWFGGLGIVGFLVGLVAPLKDLAIAARGQQTIELPGQRLVLATEHTPKGGGTTFGRGEPVTTDMLTAPESVLAAPEDLLGNGDYLIRLHRLEEDQLQEPTKLDWTDQGFVAYSAVCTHLGCTVGWEESDEKPSNVPPEQRQGPSLLCPCHISSFNPYRGAQVMGGPAPRPVPQIGVQVTEEGTIELTSEFEGPIGGG